MKTSQKGYTLVELMVVLAFIFLGASNITTFFINNMGWTEDRAKENAKLFIAENNLQVSRMSCAGDSDHDGYGSCSVILTNGEGIGLQCPTDFLQTKVFRARGCKELGLGQQKFILGR